MGSEHQVLRRRSSIVRVVLFGLSLLGGCAREHAPARDRSAAAAPALHGPADSLIAPGPLGAAIQRGRAFLLATRDSLPSHVGNNLRCVSCHLDAGRRHAMGSWVGVYARYPQYRPRSATVETIEYRVNDCFRRSMNGAPLAVDGAEMRDIIAYLWFLSRDVPIEPTAPGNRLQQWAQLTADTTAGAAVYAASCTKCHGPTGQGTAVAPPVWGPQSYNIGAGMARIRTAEVGGRAREGARTLVHNAPIDRGGRMFELGRSTTHRRGFLGRIAASAAAFGLGGLVAPLDAAARPTRAATG